MIIVQLEFCIRGQKNIGVEVRLIHDLVVRNILQPSFGLLVISFNRVNFCPGTKSKLNVDMKRARMTRASIWKKQNKTKRLYANKQSKGRFYWYLYIFFNFLGPPPSLRLTRTGNASIN